MASETVRYRAFLSYSHIDERWGLWLHKALESYRVPKRLVGRPTIRGPVPATLFPIFRDREELASSSNLSETIEDALAQSEFLIVICSPNAARSEWVNQEIATFQRMGGESRILAVIVDGVPNAEVSSGEAGCFAPALISGNREPGAADVRPGRDDRRTALLRLLAPLIGVDFDELRQRDLEAARRRSLIRGGIAAAFALLLILAAAAGWMALQRKEEARRESLNKQVERLRVIAGKTARLAQQGHGTEALLRSLDGLKANPDAMSAPPPELFPALASAIRAPQFAYDLSDPSLTFLGARYSRNERFVVTRSTRSDRGGFAVIHDGQTGRKLEELQADMPDLSDSVTWPAAAEPGVVIFYRPFGREDRLLAFSPWGEPMELGLAPLPSQRVIDDGDESAVLLLRDGRVVLVHKSEQTGIASVPLRRGQTVLAAKADRQVLLIADGTSLQVVHAEDGATLAGPWPYTGKVCCAAFNAEADRVAAVFAENGNYSGTIFSLGDEPARQLALAPNEQLTRVLGDPDDFAAAVSFDDASDAVVVLWKFGEVWRWDLAGNFIGRTQSPFGEGLTVSLSPLGTWVLQDQHAWRTKSSRPDHPLKIAKTPQSTAGRSNCPQPAGEQSTFTICPAGTNRLYRVGARSSLTVPHVGEVEVFDRNAPPYSIAITPDGRYLPALRNCDSRNRCELLLLDLQKEVVVARQGDVVRPDHAAVTDDGRLAALFRDTEGLFWDTTTGRMWRAVRHDASIVSGFRAVVSDALFIGNDRLATSGTDGTIRVWSAPGGIELTRDNTRSGFADWLFLSADSQYLLACYQNYTGDPGCRPIDVSSPVPSMVPAAHAAARHERPMPGLCGEVPLREHRERLFEEAELSPFLNSLDELDRDLLFLSICMDRIDQALKKHPRIPRERLERTRDIVQNRPR